MIPFEKLTGSWRPLMAIIVMFFQKAFGPSAETGMLGVHRPSGHDDYHWRLVLKAALRACINFWYEPSA